MFLFYSFPLCQHTYLSAAGKVHCTFSKPSYDQKIHKQRHTIALPPYHDSTIPTECQTPLTCSIVPESSRSLTVSGKPEDSWDLCTAEGFCAILVLPIGKVGSQPSVPTPDTIMHMKPMQANINKTC